MATRTIDERTVDDDVSTRTATCPECGGDIRTTTQELVCTTCGLVIAEHRIDHGPEWRSGDGERTSARTGAPVTVARHDRGLATEIGFTTDANGNRVSARKRRQLARLRREQSRGRFQSKAERNLAHGLGEIRRIASRLGVAESIRNQACQLFRTAQTEQLLRGRSIESIAAASVFAACRCAGSARLLTEVVAHTRVGENRVANAYRTLNRELGLPAPPTTPVQFVPRLATTLDCSDRVRQRAQTLATQAVDAGVTAGAHPAAFAAACVYKAAQEYGNTLTQADVAAAAEVTVPPVRAHRDTLDEERL